MKSMMIDGYKFEGPYVPGKDEIPAIDGIALICSEAGEGVKIMAIEQADDLSTLAQSPNLQNWIDHAYNGIVDIYVIGVEHDKRDKITQSLISRRAKSLCCQPFEEIVDDW